jgi:tetratricopeptide (TPR) repeat protein
MALLRNGEKGSEHRLKSWKQIASFFGTDERTVKRWEAKRGLPVRRIPGGAKATVYAETAELEQWLKGTKPTASVAPVRSRPRRIWAVGAAFGALLVAGGVGLGLRSLGPASASPVHHHPSRAVADLYFAGRYNFERRTPESLNRAVQLFGEAIRRDPAYAEAYAGLANCHLLLREYAGVPDEIAYPRARAAAERALALDDGLADAHAALAFVAFFYDRNFAAGLGGFRRAIALDPASAGAHHWYATALLHAGEVPAALAEINEAQRLEPQSHAILADKALILFSAGHVPEAVAQLRQMEAADPDYLSPHAYLAGIHLVRGDYPAYLAEERIAARLTGSEDRASIVAAADRGYAAGGGPAMFAAMLARQRALYAAGREHPFTLAATYALAGNRGEAMRALTAAVRDRDPYLVGLRVDLRFAALRAEPDFQRMERSVGGG